MGRGKEICHYLRKLRVEMARLNGIEYTPKPCDCEDECYFGACPQCDEEAKYLSDKLDENFKNGKDILCIEADIDGELERINEKYKKMEEERKKKQEDESENISHPLMGCIRD